MSLASPQGRRERNKAEKLERILAAAAELFADHGVDEVTTQQIAEKADIGSGTLFLYARTKGELLLMVQNANYARALERGRAAAQHQEDRLEAVLAVLRPVVECNRAQVDNGRTYLREVVFGDASEPHHERALSIVAETEAAVAAVLSRGGAVEEDAARVLAHVVSAVVVVTLTVDARTTWSPDEVVDHLRGQLAIVLPR